MARLAGAVFLFCIAFFMLAGFLRGGGFGGAQLIAFFLVVVLPAVWGSLLVRAHLRSKEDFSGRRERLRRRTLRAEVVRLAARRGGKLTALEAVSDLALDLPEAEQLLKEIAVDGIAEVELGESGTIVYNFRDLATLDGEKASAKGVLDA